MGVSETPYQRRWENDVVAVVEKESVLRMVRTPYIDENGLKKGAWSPAEDDKLRAYIQRYGHWNWRELPKFAGLARCGKSCRLRWLNYLRPTIKHGNYTKEEEELISKLHEQHGNRWSLIAKHLPGRTDNEVKNYWHTHLKKRVHQHQTKTKKGKKQKSIRESEPQELISTKLGTINLHSNLAHIDLAVQILESCPIYPSSTTELSTLSSETLSTPINDNNNHNYFSSFHNSGLGVVSDSGSNIGFKEFATNYSWDALGELLDESFWTEPLALENNQDRDNELNYVDSVSSPSMNLEIMNFSSLLS